MADMSMQDTQVGRRIANLLDSLGDVMAASERAEIGRFLRAAEYGLALDTLSWLLVEEASRSLKLRCGKSIVSPTL